MQENAASQVPQTPPPHVPALPPCDAHTHCHLQNDQDQDCGAAYIEDDARFIYQAKDPKHNWQRDVLQPEDWAHFEKLGVAYKKYTQTKIGGRPLWTKNPLTFSLEIGYRAFELDEVVQGIRILFGEPFDEEVPVEDTEGLMWHSFAISSEDAAVLYNFPNRDDAVQDIEGLKEHYRPINPANWPEDLQGVAGDFVDFGNAHSEPRGFDYLFEHMPEIVKQALSGIPCDAKIKIAFLKATFESWFKGLKPEEKEDGNLVLLAPSDFIKSYVESHFEGALRKVILAAYPDGTSFDIRVGTADPPPPKIPLPVSCVNQPAKT
eukprot:g8543.t1